MDVVSLIGIVAAIAVFVFLCFKGMNMLFNTMVAAMVIIITSWLDPMESITSVYMSGFIGFFKSYFLLFVLSALFGKVMEDTGAVRKIALSLTVITMKSKKHAKFWTVFVLPLFYFFLSYVGISGFVVIFTVLAIGREVFERCDIPWCLYPYGSAGIFPALLLGGSLYSTNIIAANGFGTSLYAGMGLSVVCVAVAVIVLMGLLYLDVRKFEKKGEGFLPTGAPIMERKMDEQVSEEELPSLICSLIPLLTPIICLVAFKLDVLIALSLAILMCGALNFKKMVSVRNTLGKGIVAAYGPLVSVCGAVGFVSVVKISAGFALILQKLDALPPMYGALALGALTSAVVGSSSSSLTPVMSNLVEKYAQAGISAASAHRLAITSVFPFMGPHNSGVVNALALTKIKYTQGAWLYFKTTAVPGFMAMAAAIILIKLGIFV